jgi:hypothetical protein
MVEVRERVLVMSSSGVPELSEPLPVAEARVAVMVAVRYLVMVEWMVVVTTVVEEPVPRV